MNNLLDLFQLTREMRGVTRYIHAEIGSDRAENLAEHSYQLALVAWYLNDYEDLNFDLGKIFLYALVHDLVEVYAGDTNAHDAEGMKTKEEREHQAFLKLKERFEDSFPKLATSIESYERKDSPEALFVYATDKILPILNAYVDPRFWHEWQAGIGPTESLGYTEGKINNHPVIQPYYEKIKDLIMADRDRYFAPDLE